MVITTKITRKEKNIYTPQVIIKEEARITILKSLKKSFKLKFYAKTSFN
jgi:hypothetical protein